MKIKIIKDLKYVDHEVIISPVFGKKSLKGLEVKYPGIRKILKIQRYRGELGEKLIINPASPKSGSVILIGAGSVVNPDSLRKLAKDISRLIKEFKLKKSKIDLSGEIKFNKIEISNFIDFLYLNLYRFKKYSSEKNTFGPELISICTKNIKESEGILTESEMIGRVVGYIRDLINDTPTAVTPEFMKSRALALSKKKNVTTEIFEEERLKEEGLNGILTVGRGSPNKPLLAKISYVPKNYTNEISIVGKGITYDSGGLNIKTGSHMSTMKSDMSGSAIALGIIDLISDFDLPLKVTSFLPLAENMPGDSSYKPDDVITFRNDKGVEILNTDAEGRLVLADAIILASEEHPDYIIELSTLTGSIVAALGDSIAGLFSTNRFLNDKLKKAGELTGEFVWEMPMYSNYKKSIKSEITDLKNARYGSASSVKAGLFLDAFSGKVPFAHIDIAGTAYIRKETEYHSVTGSTGFGIRLLYYFLKSL